MPRPRSAAVAQLKAKLVNRLRVSGFLSVHPEAVVHKAGSWFYEEAARVAPKLLRFDGVFCANDRLASAVTDAAKKRKPPGPLVVGFDDAPVAETLDFTTIAIPWADVAAAEVDVARRRMAGDVRTAAALSFAPRPLVRGDGFVSN